MLNPDSINTPKDPSEVFYVECFLKCAECIEGLRDGTDVEKQDLKDDNSIGNKGKVLLWTNANCRRDSSESIKIDNKCAQNSDLKIKRDKRGEIEILLDNESAWEDNVKIQEDHRQMIDEHYNTCCY